MVSSRLKSTSVILYNLYAIYYFLRSAVVVLYTFGPCLKQNKTLTQNIYKIGMIQIPCRSSESAITEFVCACGNLCAHVGICGTCGNLCVHVGICVCMWKSVCTCGNLFAHVEICVHMWESVCACGSR